VATGAGVGVAAGAEVAAAAVGVGVLLATSVGGGEALAPSVAPVEPADGVAVADPHAAAKTATKAMEIRPVNRRDGCRLLMLKMMRG
jgi:hypothetical protein